jgi:hypothetical protein
MYRVNLLREHRLALKLKIFARNNWNIQLRWLCEFGQFVLVQMVGGWALMVDFSAISGR